MHVDDPYNFRPQASRGGKHARALRGKARELAFAAAAEVAKINASTPLHEIFARNTPVPNMKQMTFTTSIDNQADLQMRISQGAEVKADMNTLLGEFTFSGIRPKLLVSGS